MGQLHELLAVESDLKGIHDKIVTETMKTFEKENLFTGHSKRLEMKDEDRNIEEEAGADEKEMTTTVMKRLQYTASKTAPYYDALLQKEMTNQKAVANLVVNGEVVFSNLPATFLLGLETRLKLLRSVYEAAPTLAPGIHWKKDLTLGEDVYRNAYDDITSKTEKKIVPQILYDATDKHPAQVEKLTNDVVVGKFIKSSWSGMISSSDKARLLGNLDELIRAVKKARMRANQIEVTPEAIGDKLFELIHR